MCMNSLVPSLVQTCYDSKPMAAMPQLQRRSPANFQWEPQPGTHPSTDDIHSRKFVKHVRIPLKFMRLCTPASVLSKCVYMNALSQRE